jgi:hypothetical protein
MKETIDSGPSILRVERDLLFSQTAAARRIPAKWPLTEGERKLPSPHHCRRPQVAAPRLRLVGSMP